MEEKYMPAWNRIDFQINIILFKVDNVHFKKNPLEQYRSTEYDGNIFWSLSFRGCFSWRYYVLKHVIIANVVLLLH